jgi:hypothetical protein
MVSCRAAAPPQESVAVLTMVELAGKSTSRARQCSGRRQLLAGLCTT